MSDCEPEGYALHDRLKRLIQPKSTAQSAAKPVEWVAAQARYYLDALPPDVVLEVSL
ncbi:hypothetical protein CC1G_15384 [Coprinopsis cinerea okayama7|uniref:Uncharacterized protein n=1 Tax=Coprinopsis cinerea (strain Okayama-7 / 130 / ATCC MYA-4618 / FGSC 9003) TaxID=240176 RepID=D6RQR4_COPC7|nr:hypothetical protein CC1G_15384 [Coprinopsis cinerea okayama7\|eukprot:XP_002910106.1 hypothetical protein CC1G_15384 [Coprinopsis cinerea okayama7\